MADSRMPIAGFCDVDGRLLTSTSGKQAAQIESLRYGFALALGMAIRFWFAR